MTENLSQPYPPINESEISLGTCFSQALSEAGITAQDVGVWLDISEAKTICESVGLVFHDNKSTGGNLSIEGGKPLIVVYKTRRGRAHAEYVQDFGDVDSWD